VARTVRVESNDGRVVARWIPALAGMTGCFNSIGKPIREGETACAA
jgi:hypothetical protein